MRSALVLAVAAACGSGSPRADAPGADILPALRALPNVADVTAMPTDDAGYTYYVLHFVQPVDHADPSSATFLQEVSLIHKDAAAPLVVWTSGYWDYYLDSEVELTKLLGANQISIEHRFFGASRPSPADWSKLTIEQMADDEHAIVSALRAIYTGPAIASGGSKGGMTATFYRRFFPDDVAGTVPYVAPISYGAPDERYPPFIANVGPSDCHQAVRDLAIEIIANHRAAMEQRAMQDAQAHGYVYSRVAIGPAVESAIEGLEWSFWQYFGVGSCSNVPATTASDDDQLAGFEAYVYQAYFQLGYPDDGTTYLQPYYMYGAADYAGAFPAGVAPPTYDGGAAMFDIDGFVEEDAQRMLFVYGQWDPWTGGAYQLRGTRDSLLLVEPDGTHDSDISALVPADTQAAFGKLAAWTGVAPPGFVRVAHRPRGPHLPAAIGRTLRARMR